MILNHHNPIDLNYELKVVGKNNQYITQVHINNFVKQMVIKYGELIRQFNFKIKVSANVRYEKYAEDEPIEILDHHIPIEIINNLTRIQLNVLDVISSLDNGVQRREMQGSGWNLRGVNYLKICFHKTYALNGRKYVKFRIRTNSILNIQTYDTYCFLWSFLANVHPVDKDPQRVTKYGPYRNELNIANIEFQDGMKIVNIPRFEILKPTLAINLFEYSTDEDNDYKLVPLYIAENNENRRIIDLILYKNHYILLKKLHVLIGKQDRRYVCRNCLNSYTNQSELTTHKRLCGS